MNTSLIESKSTHKIALHRNRKNFNRNFTKKEVIHYLKKSLTCQAFSGVKLQTKKQGQKHNENKKPKNR